ncbi:MAG: 5'/3'-nucleotidase SurE [Anaerolineae bacterium]|nr:5'/3'-nucleotidase SurE [Anaerolineae bacterium]MCZ7551874.1 5'/3'-nucleotidase SurE [Anaerolineales bacterium]
MSKPQILLTNDDGIQSHGLWAAAESLSKLGFVHVAAPREQSSAAGRSMPGTSDGRIETRQVIVDGKEWTVHAVGGTPAQTVLHALLEILPERPQLVVAGINYGENVGSGVTISGTVGAAMEAATLGVPAIAISLQVEPRHHYSLSDEVDFSTAAYFAAYFGRLMLNKKLPDDVDVLKVEVPCNASPETPWVVTRLSRLRYYEPMPPERRDWSKPARVGYQITPQLDQEDALTDVYAVGARGWVSVTPLSLDLTSRVELAALDELLRADQT